MRHTIAALLILGMLCGCGRKKSEPRDPSVNRESEVDSFKTTDIPVPPAPADLSPVSQGVSAAKTDVESAKKNVDVVLDVARKSDAPVAQQAVPPLSQASTQLTSANVSLATVQTEIGALKEQMKAEREANDKRDKTRLEDIARLEKACKLDNAASNKQIEAERKRVEQLEKENEELKNEDTRKARHRLMGVGIALLLIGVGSFVAMFAAGFVAGRIIGPLATPMGLVCLWIALNLDKIMWWTEVGIVATALCFALWVAWKLFWHEPKRKPKAEVNG